jgi:hypothetical protein
VLAELARIPFHSRTMADLYEQWMEVAGTMGRLAQERAQLVASLSREGTAGAGVDLLAARRQWIRAASMFVESTAFMDIPEKTREAIIAPLERIREALRTSRGQSADDEPLPDEASGPQPDATTATTAAPIADPASSPPLVTGTPGSEAAESAA